MIARGLGNTAAVQLTANEDIALNQSEERFHLLVDSVRDYAIFMLDPRGVVTTWNTGAQRIKGYTEQDIVGQHFSRFYTPEDRERHLPEVILATAEQEGRCQIQGWRVRKDGTRFWADVTVTAIRQDDGTLVGFAKVTRDLTERHAAIEALRQSEERFRLLMECVVDYAIFMLDVDGYIVSWNAGAERIKGYTEQEIIGQHFSAFYTEEQRAAGHPAEVLAAATRDGRYEEENWRVRKDGTRFWANVVVTALRDATGTLQGFAKVTRDLTERRQVEAERQQRAAAEAAAQMRAEFLNVAAHELKTPITALRARAQLTQRRFQRSGELSGEAVVKAMDVIESQAAKITRLVDQLLDVSRLEAGHLALEREDSDVVALVHNVAGLFSDREDSNRIQLEVPDHPVLASLDALRIEQVLINLIENALKYSPAPLPVLVRVSSESAETGGQGEESSSPSAAGRQVRIVVVDQGPGVPPEDRSRLFDRFFRSSTTSQTSGMGLGLYVSRQIVELHGGRIELSFPPEGGMCVEVFLAALPS